MVSIPASAVVNVTPGVISAGGTGLDLSGLLLTNSTRVPMGSVYSFATIDAVSAFFGPAAAEVAKAAVYFGGFDGSSIKPAALLFAQYPQASVAAYLRGGRVSGLTLAQLQAISGLITLTIDGVSATSSNINLSAATSFSNAASIIQTALNVSGVTVTYDSISGAFVVTSGTAGANSSITFATNTASAALMLTQATGAVTSQGAIASVPGTAMDAIVAQTQNFVSFTTVFEPVTNDCIAFAAWTNGKANRYVYVCWDTDITVTTANDTASAGYLIQQAGYSGTLLIYEPSDLNHASFVMGAIASLDFDQTDGRATLAYRSQSGIAAGVTNRQIADQLIANGYNFYGSYATANDQFTFFYPGSITGAFDWADSYVNQIWMNNAFQLDLMVLLTSVRSIPYNAAGYSLIEAALTDTINQALDFGAIRAGVTLSSLQAADVDAAAGRTVSDVIGDRGWYLLVQDPPPDVRAARGSPPCTFWYTDGGSVQRINLASVEVQ
jgi:hypothetical protein